MSKPRQTVTHLPVDQLAAHPGNIRDDLGDLGDLAKSIREHGILQPLTVTEGTDGRFLLLAGHRRLAASLLAGLTHVPVVIRHGVTDEGDQLVLMLVENCQRRDLNPIEKAEAFGALRNRGLTVAEIARQVGVSPPNVYYYLTLLDLPEAEREELRRGTVTAAAAIAEVRQQREQQRKVARPTSRSVGRPKGATSAPWFSDRHPLAKTVRRMCTHRGRKKVGGVGCGPCWEHAIRQAAGVEAVPDEIIVDEVVVERILAGDYKTPCNPAEKSEALRRWAFGGKSINDLLALTGWKKAERYFNTADLIDGTEAVAS